MSIVSFHKYDIHTVYEADTSRGEGLQHLDLYLARIAFEQEEIIILLYLLRQGTCYCCGVFFMTAKFSRIVTSKE